MALRFFILPFAMSAIAGSLPQPMTVTNFIDGDDIFNVTTGTPGSCSCETPACNLNPSTGFRLFQGDSRSFTSDNCEYYNIGGGVASQDGNPCASWRADDTGCTVTSGGVTGDCSRLSNFTCESGEAAGGLAMSLLAAVDRECDTLPYAGCMPGESMCCGANDCMLAEPSTTYYMCQPGA